MGFAPCGCLQTKSPFPERGRGFEIDRKSSRPNGAADWSKRKFREAGGLAWRQLASAAGGEGEEDYIFSWKSDRGVSGKPLVKAEKSCRRENASAWRTRHRIEQKLRPEINNAQIRAIPWCGAPKRRNKGFRGDRLEGNMPGTMEAIMRLA